uniref:Uncharacterized protein n=1 Tax=Glossina austeni TaxID=7395 RepID=A0A1A9VVP8_GLOAU
MMMMIVYDDDVADEHVQMVLVAPNILRCLGNRNGQDTIGLRYVGQLTFLPQENLTNQLRNCIVTEMKPRIITSNSSTVTATTTNTTTAVRTKPIATNASITTTTTTTTTTSPNVAIAANYTAMLLWLSLKQQQKQQQQQHTTTTAHNNNNKLQKPLTIRHQPSTVEMIIRNRSKDNHTSCSSILLSILYTFVKPCCSSNLFVTIGIKSRLLENDIDDCDLSAYVMLAYLLLSAVQSRNILSCRNKPLRMNATTFSLKPKEVRLRGGEWWLGEKGEERGEALRLCRSALYIGHLATTSTMLCSTVIGNGIASGRLLFIVRFRPGTDICQEHKSLAVLVVAEMPCMGHPVADNEGLLQLDTDIGSTGTLNTELGSVIPMEFVLV